MIEWSVRLGDILTIAAFLGGGLAAYYQLKTDVNVLKHDFSSMKTSVDLLSTAMKGFSEIITKIAVQENRMDNIEKRLDELRHGEGFVGVKVERSSPH